MTSDASLADQTFFQGFSNPTQNWSRLPHALIDALPLIETLAEMKVILYVLRHTWGYREYEQGKRITLDEFMHGRKNGKGKRIDSGVGMAKRNIIEGIRRAIKHGFLAEDVDAKDKARIKKTYRLSMYQNDTSDDDGQVYRNDTTEVSNRYIGGIKSIHRTKNKETKERNSTKKDSAQTANALAQADESAKAVEPPEKQESTEPTTPVIDEVLSERKNVAARNDAGKVYLNLGNNRFQGPYAPYSTKRPAGTFLNAEMLPPDAVIVPLVAAAKAALVTAGAKAPRRAQPTDVLFDAVADNFFDGVKSERVGWIVNGNPKQRCDGLIAFECQHQGRERNELDYDQLAVWVKQFAVDYRRTEPGRELKDCAKFRERWEGYRRKMVKPVKRTARADCAICGGSGIQTVEDARGYRVSNDCPCLQEAHHG